MFKSLLFLGALAPSMLSGNVPPRSLDNNPTVNVGDVYRLEVTVDFSYSSTLPNDYFVTRSVLLFNGDYEDNGEYNVIKFLPSTFTISTSNDAFINLSTIPFSCDFCDIPLSFNYSRNTTSYNIDLITCDDIDDTSYAIPLTFYSSYDTQSLTYSIDFEILLGGDVFTDDILPYLTKVETPYTPPAKSNLYRLLYDFYYSLFNDDDLSSINTSTNLPFDSWLCHSLTIITLIGLVFILFLLLRWLFKVISGLILLKL